MVKTLNPFHRRARQGRREYIESGINNDSQTLLGIWINLAF